MQRMSPVAASGVSDAEEIIAGYDFTCARLSSGAVACWGANGDRQLGDGTTVDQLSPTVVAGLP